MKQSVLMCLGLTFSGLFIEPVIANNRPSPIGRQVKEFTLQDFRGKEHSLSEFKDQKLLVVVFLGTECPLAKLYSSRLVELAAKYDRKQVGFVGINSNSHDSLTEIAAQARRYKIGFPILKDLSNHVADQMGAERTPEVFVLDEDRVIQYRGRIDNQYGVGFIRDKATKHDLKVALDELLAGKSVSTPATEAEGCIIGRVKKPKADSEVTYTNQIARILQQRCVECHRPGEIAPFSLTDYDEVAGWAETIEEVVRDQRMPPWHADPEVGNFRNDRHLSNEEKQLIFNWVKNGAPEGDPADLPEPRAYPEGWQLPRDPDAVVHMSDNPVRVQAEGFVGYKYFIVDPGFEEDKWFNAVEVRPGNHAVVHHILVFARSPQELRRSGGGIDGFLASYVPGRRAVPFPEGMAKRIPAGAKLIFQMHYTPIGVEQEDRSKVAFNFMDPDKVTHEVQTTSAFKRSLRIKDGDPNYKVTAEPKRVKPSLLLSMMPHMHLRGKSFRYEAHYPDGEKEVLLDIPAYDFNWQTSYRLTDPKPLPAGTRMHCVAHYDNSEGNLNNPDPTRVVPWGDQTYDEMMIGYFDIAVPKAQRRQASGGSVTESSVSERTIARFKGYDSNGDGKLSRDEVSARQLELWDEDKDGEVTLPEFKAWVLGR